jgi:hypothetical protein
MVQYGWGSWHALPFTDEDEILPKRGEAASEEVLHAARKRIFSGLFASLAWYERQGAWDRGIAALLLAEVLVLPVSGRREKSPAGAP